MGDGSTGSIGGNIGVACADAPPYTTSGTAAVNLTVNAATPGAAWNRFYERGVSADHANTILSTAWGRNIQGALKKAHAEAGFSYARFHGILNSDIGVYTEVGGVPTYNWAKFDQVYDAVVAAGMRAIVEISFMPPPLASDAARTLHWYNGVPANISPARDWTRWQAFMAEIVRHLETRYGAEEIRANWYFEVWNESSWMYSLSLAGYNELYRQTVTGLLAGDPQIRVGGPAESGPASPGAIGSLLTFARANNLKLDFISYHRYGNDAGAQVSDANGMQAFHRTLVNQLRTANFTGELINDEWGPSWTIGTPARDNESSASFVAKTIHLIGTDTTAAPPSMYSYWTVSDLYEEVDTGTARAYREGNWGLMLKGDARFPESFDVAKPVFNAFRLLHRMGATQVPLTGGTTGDGVNGVATISADRTALQILVYNHATFTGGTSEVMADSSQSTLVSLTVNGIPFAPGELKVRHYLVDRTHSNSYSTWVGMQKPAMPTQAQWVSLRDSAEVCYYDTAVNATGSSWTVTFPQATYSVALIEITR
jgi:xylan 1,4-beta-xylosidase